MVTSNHEIELTVRNLCNFEIRIPPAAAMTGIAIVPGKIPTPAPTSECRWLVRNYYLVLATRYLVFWC